MRPGSSVGSSASTLLELRNPVLEPLTHTVPQRLIVVPILLPTNMDELRTQVRSRYNARLFNPEHRRIHMPLPPVCSILLLATHQMSVPSKE